MTTDYRKDDDAMRRAVAVAQYVLGDDTWAGLILEAYFNPDDPVARESIAELGDALEIAS
jgi:hypothetical protein